MKRFIGILIVFVGGVLALTALLGFAIDESGLLASIQAPAFEPALSALLESYNTVFTALSFALVFFILVCSVIALAKGSTHMGFTIMIAALFAGFSAWPHGTPFMLIVIFGAHWIAVAEMQASAVARAAPPAAAPPPAAPAPAPPSPSGAAQQTANASGGSAVGSSESASGDSKASDDTAGGGGREGFAKRVWKRFFH